MITTEYLDRKHFESKHPLIPSWAPNYVELPVSTMLSPFITLDVEFIDHRSVESSQNSDEVALEGDASTHRHGHDACLSNSTEIDRSEQYTAFESLERATNHPLNRSLF